MTCSGCRQARKRLSKGDFFGGVKLGLATAKRKYHDKYTKGINEIIEDIKNNKTLTDEEKHELIAEQLK